MPPDPLAPLLALPGVADGVGAARQAVDALLGHRVLRRRSAEVSAESALRGAWASAWLSGAEVALAEVRDGTAAATPIVQGALRAQAGIADVVDTWPHAPRQALARLHALAALDVIDDRDALGRPQPDAEVSARLDTLADVLTVTTAPAAVVAAIVQGEVLSLDAFPPSSGVVARAAARLTLIDRGLDPKSLAVIEVGHRELRAQYVSALAEYRTATPAGVAHWVTHCCEAIVVGAREASAICEALGRG